jgi:uncharacterized protein (DUF2235 family)
MMPSKDDAGIAKRRLALFLDGTWNNVNSNTNVWRLKSLCKTQGSDQLVYYNVGLGTTTGAIVRGGVFGYGIDEVVVDAYEWLIQNYEDNDEIFIFGFSRGAYTARSLSGFVSRCGLAKLGSPLSLPQFYDRYKQHDRVLTIRELNECPPNYNFTQFEKWMIKYCRSVDVEFTGVWDTVGALADTSHFTALTGGNHDFLDTNLRRPQKHVFHAMALDEHRKIFEVDLLRRYVKKTGDMVLERTLDQVEQRWFVGAHSNVGGGIPNDQLAQIPLKWLMDKAIQQGLEFRDVVEIDPDVIMSPVEDSFAEFAKGAYKLFELGQPFYRPLDLPPEERSTTIVHTINETIDGSVFERWRKDATYRPQNLQDWARKHGGLDPASLITAVRANDPKIAAP